MATRMQQRRGTAEQWLLADPVLAAGEIGFETDTGSFKLGDGVNNWLDLDYFETSAALAGTLGDYIEISEKGQPLGVAELDATGNVPASQLGNAPDPDLSSYATTQYVDDEIAAIPAPDYTGLATEDYVDTAIENVVGLAPEDLDTLAELAAALGDNPEAITTLQSDVSALQTDKADTNSPTFTGLTDFEGIVDFSDAVVVGIDALPDQAGNDGKYLTTDGNTASWQTVASPTPHPFTMIG
jgi:hypothetical protein